MKAGKIFLQSNQAFFKVLSDISYDLSYSDFYNLREQSKVDEEYNADQFKEIVIQYVNQAVLQNKSYSMVQIRSFDDLCSTWLSQIKPFDVLRKELSKDFNKELATFEELMEHTQKVFDYYNGFSTKIFSILGKNNYDIQQMKEISKINISQDF